MNFLLEQVAPDAPDLIAAIPATFGQCPGAAISALTAIDPQLLPTDIAQSRPSKLRATGRDIFTRGAAG